ncbi:hypothetical protein G6F68_018550 [Rhizopus microsporus]|nr:hypothetical protein G6F68_018550 [Rhizopus microsporus]
MAAVHHTVLHGFQHLAGLHQITGGEDLDVEAPVGDFSHIPRNVLRAREQRGRFVREAGRQPPRHGGRFLREGRSRQRSATCGGAQGSLLQKRAALHGKNLQVGAGNAPWVTALS